MRSLGRYALTEEIGTAAGTILEEFTTHLLGAPSQFLQLATR